MSKIDSRRILFQDEHLLAVNKLDGELTVTAGGRGKLPLFDFLKREFPSLRVVHRLDFGTSGVLLFAKNAQAVARLRESQGRWVKKYQALVAGVPPSATGTITKKLPARTRDAMVDAVSHYTVLEAFGIASLVEVTIETGRKHQVRLHLQSIGHPLLLDPLYGNEKLDRSFRRSFHYQRFFLHAAAMSVPHPATGGMIHLLAPLPMTFSKALRELRAAKVRRS